MAANTTHRNHNITGEDDEMPVPASHCIPWLFVHITECLAIAIFNIITIIVFVKQRKQLQRRSTYLIIHLAVVDLLAGAVSGPLQIEFRMAEFCQLWNFNFDISLLRLKAALGFFPVASLINLAVISLERLHATFCPFNHRFMANWVYGASIIVFWVIIASMQATEQLIVSNDLSYYIFYFLCFFIPLFTILISYASIFFKVRYSRHLQHLGAAVQRDRKLTRTLFLVTLGSLFTWLPLITYQFLLIFHPELHITFESEFHVDMLWQTILLSNSLINPIIYAMRMPEVRAGILQHFRRNSNHVNPLDLPLHDI